MNERQNFECRPVAYRVVNCPHGPVRVVSRDEYYYNGRRYYRDYQHGSQGQRVNVSDHPAPE